MGDVIVIGIIVVVVAAVVAYIVRQKKNGVKCIGCPTGGKCGHKKEDNHSCNCGKG